MTEKNQDVSIGNIETAGAEVYDELIMAMAKYPPFRSAHEGYAVLCEEVDELWHHVRSRQGGGRDVVAMRKEAMQVAAMALRFMLDVCSTDESGQK